ncbi:hypothetical protein AB3X91_33810 [Paraburkholderia sp. BR14263]|uniref:TRAFAC clade GTPase domain-containing protein n=1 Tax=unclassified Paraburkholderia TaxID=2615204 RepID=UPI0034CD2A39
MTTPGCPHPNCFAPDLSCALGSMQLSDCEAWNGKASSGDTPAEASEEILLPWSGDAMGLSDLNFVSGRTKPLTVGIAGPGSAGKTTLLASWYLLLGRGLLLDDQWYFGGSYSLPGWETVASSLTFAAGQLPTFPPHTTSRGARAPGLLHVALRKRDGRLKDVVFADSPGEWFQHWAVDEAADNAEGARWVAKNADVFLLIADREALSGPKLGTARNAFQLLAKRIAAHRRGRPVALVWTKGDIDVDPQMESTIRRAVRNDIPDASEFSVSVFAQNGETGVGFQDLFAWVLETRRTGARLESTSTTVDPLFMIGRR